MLSEASTSAIWEYTIVHSDRLNSPSGPQLAPMWKRKYADGSTDWDQINKLGEDGWEMVNAFPVESGGTLQDLAFVFKRPKRLGGPPGGGPALAENAADQELPALPSPSESAADGA